MKKTWMMTTVALAVAGSVPALADWTGKGEAGIAVVRVCVNPDGSRDGVPALQTTSGFARLDEAAVKWATEALRFKPAAQGGTAVRACQGFRVKFRLVTTKA